MTRLLPPAVFEQSSKPVRLKICQSSSGGRKLGAGKVVSRDHGSVLVDQKAKIDGLKSLIEYVEQLLIMKSTTPEFRLYEWRLRTFHKWIREPGFESLQSLIFVKKRANYVLSIINDFVTQEYIESQEGQSLAPYYLIALLHTGQRLDLVAFLRKHNWNQIFGGHNQNLTSFFLRIIHHASEQASTEQRKQRLKDLILECFRYLYKHRYLGSISLMVRYLQEYPTDSSRFSGKAEPMVERMLNRYQDKLLRSTDAILVDNLSGVFRDTLAYEATADVQNSGRSCESSQPSPNPSVSEATSSSSITQRNRLLAPTRHILMKLLVNYCPTVFNNLYFLKFIWLKIQPKLSQEAFRQTISPILCSQILHDNYDHWSSIGGIKQFIEYIFSTIQTTPEPTPPPYTNGHSIPTTRRPPTPPPQLQPDIFINKKLAFTRKMPDSDLVEFLKEFSDHVSRLSDHLKLAFEKMDRSTVLESLFHKQPSLKYLIFVEDLYTLAVNASKNDGSPSSKAASQYPRDLELTLQFLQRRRKIEARFIPNRCLCGFKKSFAAFKSMVLTNRREHLVEIVENEAFGSYLSNVLKSFVICEEQECQQAFYICIEEIIRYGVVSEAGAVALVNRLFTKLPKTVFNKSKMKSVLSYFAQILPEPRSKAVKDERGTTVTLNVDQIKAYAKLCPSKRINRLIQELYLKTPKTGPKSVKDTKKSNHVQKSSPTKQLQNGHAKLTNGNL